MSRYVVMMFFLVWIVIGVGPAAAAKIRHLSTVTADDTGDGMLFPTGVACGGGTLLVADSGNGRLLSGTILEDRDPLLKAVQVQSIQVPIAAARLSNGNYLVLDGKSKNVGKIDGTDLSFKGFLKLQKIPAPAGVIIKALAIDGSDQIYLLDTYNERILVVDEQGLFLRVLDFPKGSGFISDVSVDESGTVYLVDSVNNQVLAAASGDTQFQALGSPQTAAVDFLTGVTAGQSSLFMVDRRQGRIILVGFDGSILEYKFGNGFDNGQLRFPTDLCLDEKRRLFIADQGHNRVQIFEIKL